jgi:ribosomal protein S18 acetylase RimI-like enzyme
MMVSAENDPRIAGTIWMLNLDETVPVVQPLITTTFRRIDPQDLPVPAMEQVTSNEWLKRFETGRRCYAVWVEDQLACYGWVSFEEEHIGELNLRVRLLPGEVYIWDCATLPAFRQKRLYSALLSFMIGELGREGLCRAWIGADKENLPSQQGMTRAGFRHVADLLIENVLAIRQVWVQGRPDMPEHVVAEARRAFLNDRDESWSAATALGS